MSSIPTDRSPVGRCPECAAKLSDHDVLISYRTRGGATASWADCPRCREVVHPE